MGKNLLYSKTLWFNLITVAIGIVEVISKTYPIDPQTLAYIIGAGNIVLRLLTDKPIVFAGKTILGRQV